MKGPKRDTHLTGDISNFVEKNHIENREIIKNVFYHLIFMISDLVYNYKVVHGDLNSGNILIKKTNKQEKNYSVNEQIYTIPLYGYEPMLIDFGRSSVIRKEEIDDSIIIEEVSKALYTCLRYHTNKQHYMNNFLSNINIDLFSFEYFLCKVKEIIDDIV